mmetsp:Transcript_37721/g.67365  ORF Transcript_37721/g.67365 Transcript_37721/m.67365 type:complete len:227 (-) Transcript_37721:264-944(-)
MHSNLGRQNIAQDRPIPADHCSPSVVTAGLDAQHFPGLGVSREGPHPFAFRTGHGDGCTGGGTSRCGVPRGGGWGVDASSCPPLLKLFCPSLAVDGPEEDPAPLGLWASAFKADLKPRWGLVIEQLPTQLLGPLDETNVLIKCFFEIDQSCNLPFVFQSVWVHVVHHGPWDARLPGVWLRRVSCDLLIRVCQAQQVRRGGHVEGGVAEKLTDEAAGDARLPRPQVS